MSIVVKGNVDAFFKSKYSNAWQPISQLSKSDHGTFFVDSPTCGWNFDAITKSLFTTNAPTSVDGTFVVGKFIYFVEFKSGFKNLVSEKNMDLKKVECPYKENKPCEEYAQLLIDENKWLCEVLKTNVQLKAAESYRTFEKKIVPSINENECERRYCTSFIAVVDQEDPSKDSVNDEFEAIQRDLAQRASPENNYVADMYNRLCRYAKPELWYDESIAMSASVFEKFANEGFKRPFPR